MPARLLDAFHQASASRTSFEATWRDIAALIHPTRSQFQDRALPVNGGKPGLRPQVYDSTALLAAEQLAAGLFSALTNPATPWFHLESERDPAWAEAVEGAMNAALNAGGGAFYTVLPDLFRDLVCFGTAILAIKPGPRFFIRRLEDVVLEDDGEGEIARTFRRFKLRAPAALRRFGPQTPEDLRRASERGDSHSFGHFIEVTEPLNPVRAALIGRGANLLSPTVQITVIDAHSGRTVAQHRRSTAGELILRWSTANGGPYGDSPAMLTLPDVKTLNAMCKASLLAAQKAVDPPILSAHEHGMRGLKTHPGAVIHGGLDASGRRLYQPFMDGANPGLSLEMEEQRRGQIRDAFFGPLLIAAHAPGETATAFLGRQEEKARLLAPYLARLQSEFLEPLVQRLFGQLYRAGALPRFPGPALHPDVPMVRLVSPLAQAQRLSEASRQLRLIEGVSGLGVERDTLIDAPALARSILAQAGFPPEFVRDLDPPKPQQVPS